MFDVNFINPFLGATLNVLKIQAQVIAEPGKLQVNTTQNAIHADISGIIGVLSDSFKGSIGICFPEGTFLKVMSRMLGEEFTELSPDITDGAAELTNMIFGQAKVVLNEKNYGIQMALPQILVGKEHSLIPKTSEVSVAIPFKSDCGDFYVVITTSKGKQG